MPADRQTVNGHTFLKGSNLDIGNSKDIETLVDFIEIAAQVIDTSGQLDGVTSAGHITMADAKNIVVNGTTGTKIGTATSQKLGMWNATPVTQPTHNADPAAMAGVTSAALTDVGSTSTNPFGCSTAAQLARIVTAIDALVGDVAAAKTAIDANNAAIDAINADMATIGLTAAS